MVVVVDSVVVDVVEMRQCTSPAQSDISEIIPTLLCPPYRSSLCTYFVRMLLLQQNFLSLPSILLISTTASASQVTSPHGVLFTQLAISGDRINTNCPPSLQTDPDKVHTVQSTLYIQPIILWFPSVTHIICSQRGLKSWEGDMICDEGVRLLYIVFRTRCSNPAFFEYSVHTDTIL